MRRDDDVHTLFEVMRRVSSSTRTAEVLAEIVRCVHDELGFGAVALACRAGGRLVTTNVMGPPGVAEQLLGQPLNDAFVASDSSGAGHVGDADELGMLRHIPASRVTPEIAEGGWVPPAPAVSPGPDGWHPLDMLFAPLYSGTGELVGRLSVDLPPGGRFPDRALRERLELFVVQAGLAISNAEQRAELSHRVRLAETARDAAAVSAQGDLDDRLRAVAEVVGRAFGARRCTLRCFPDGEGGLPEVRGSYPNPVRPEAPTGLREDVARRDLASPPMELLGTDTSSAVFAASFEAVRERMIAADAGHLVVMPFGAGQEPLGYLSLSRPGETSLAPLEASTLADIARHLGTVVYNYRQLLLERRLAAELTELARYKAELIATISHELKTPLTSIVGHVELLAEDDPHPSVAVIERNAKRLDALVTNLLRGSSRDQRPVVRRAVDLVALCRSSLELAEDAARTRDLTLALQHPGSAVVEADAEEVGRLLDNLVGNAVKYSRPGGRVEVTLSRTEAEAVVAVSDQGIGFSPAERRRLFGAFHRGNHPHVQGQEGTGLGLAIAARIARAHGGSIDADSVEGVGSTFIVRLPVRAERPAAEAGGGR